MGESTSAGLARTEPGPGELARLAGLVAEAVTACPGVARLVRGPTGTYLPGGIVPGVVLRDSTVAVSIVARYGPSLLSVAGQVRAAVGAVVSDRQVDVLIEDIDVPAQPPSAAGAG